MFVSKGKKILRIMRKLKVTKWFDFTYPKKDATFFQIGFVCICCGLNNMDDDDRTWMRDKLYISSIGDAHSDQLRSLTYFFKDWVVCLLWVLLHFQCILDILLFSVPMVFGLILIICTKLLLNRSGWWCILIISWWSILTIWSSWNNSNSN